MSPFPRRDFLIRTLRFGGMIFPLWTLGLFKRPGLIAADGSKLGERKEEGMESLFDGSTLSGWTRSEFGAGGEVRVENGVIVVEAGEELSGFQSTGNPPKLDYELSLEARRMSGLDFFCAITFPVGDRHLTFVVGGWGGATVGISSINGEDASHNETTSYRGFKDKEWYTIRLRVEAAQIQAWINRERVVNVQTRGKELSLRPGEIEISKPLGIATFRTGAEFRKLCLRRLSSGSAERGV
jgi:hypothetical protein